MTNMKRWTNKRIEKELYFAKAAIDPNDHRTSNWLYACEIEADRRSRMSEVH
jgi:hypothetical protein